MPNRPGSDLVLDGCQVVAKRMPNSSGPVLAKRNRPTSCFSYSIPFFHRRSDHIVRDRPGSDLVLDGHVRLGPNGSVLEASRCVRIFRPSSGHPIRARSVARSGPVPACLLGYYWSMRERDARRKDAKVYLISLWPSQRL